MTRPNWRTPLATARRGGPAPSTLTRREDDDGRALLHPTKEIDDILVGHADAARRYGLANIFRLVGAVDAIQGVLVALVKVERPRAQRIGRPSRNAWRIRAQTRLNVPRRDPVGPFRSPANRSDAGKRHRFLTYGYAIADRLAIRQHVIKITRVGIDQDRSRPFLVRIIDNMPAISLGNICLCVRRLRQQLLVLWGKARIRRR